MAYLDSSNVEDLVADIKDLADGTYAKIEDVNNLQNQITPYVEEDFIATRNYVAYDHVAINGNLYIVTTIVSSGESLIEVSGSTGNIIRINLGGEIANTIPIKVTCGALSNTIATQDFDIGKIPPNYVPVAAELNGNIFLFNSNFTEITLLSNGKIRIGRAGPGLYEGQTISVWLRKR